MTEFKVGDRVERIVAPNGMNGMTISPGCTGRITNVEIGNMFADVLWDGKTRFQCNGAEFLKKIPEEAGAQEPEFKQLKEITGHAISKHITGCTDMRDGFEHYVSMFSYFVKIHLFEDFIKYAKEQEGWLAFLIKHGFIERTEPEVFYKIGDRFSDGESEYMLCIHDSGVALNSLRNGHRWRPPVKCKNREKITGDEFNKIVCPSIKFVLIHTSPAYVRGDM